jgi:hypothetical protein
LGTAEKSVVPAYSLKEFIADIPASRTHDDEDEYDLRSSAENGER